MKKSLMPFRRIVLLAALSVTMPSSLLAEPKPNAVDYNIPDASVSANPFLANGVGVGKDVSIYWSAGTGPAQRNTAGVPAGTPERYIDPALEEFTTPTSSITEKQGLNNLMRIKENLESVGLTLEDVTFMRIYLEAPPGQTRADYAGWNNAYRKFFANINRQTGQVIPAYEPVVVPNARRPARSNLQVATLPVLGWLVEIEVIAAYPSSKVPEKRTGFLCVGCVYQGKPKQLTRPTK
jgi:enamine deaminase RidA (YjgF/YER057c/UK114 family)